MGYDIVLSTLSINKINFLNFSERPAQVPSSEDPMWTVSLVQEAGKAWLELRMNEARCPQWSFEWLNRQNMGMGQNPSTPGEHQNSWDLWMFIPLKMVSIGIDPYPYGCTNMIYFFFGVGTEWVWVFKSLLLDWWLSLCADTSWSFQSFWT